MKYFRGICLCLVLSLCFLLEGCVFDDLMSLASRVEEQSKTEATEAPTRNSSAPESSTETQAPSETTAPTETQPAEPDWEILYTSVLKALRAEYPAGQSDCSYCLYDLNGDQRPELLVKLGTCEADFKFEVFTATEQGAQNVGSLNGSHSLLCGLQNQNACLLHNAIQGYETIYKITMTNGILAEKLIYEGTPKEYHALTPLQTYPLEKAPSWAGNPADDNQAVLDNFDGGIPYLLKIPFADQSVFSGPGYDNSFVQTVELAGTYTIVEECWDYEGNLWGRLKSGVGWVDLTEIEYRIYAGAPISANYADAPLLNSGNYLYFNGGQTAYSVHVAFRAYETLSNVRFYDANLAAESGLELTPLHFVDRMTPETPFVANVDFYGDMSAFAIAFTDGSGNERLYVLTTSGRNNALVFYEN